MKFCCQFLIKLSIKNVNKKIDGNSAISSKRDKILRMANYWILHLSNEKSTSLIGKRMTTECIRHFDLPSVKVALINNHIIIFWVTFKPLFKGATLFCPAWSLPEIGSSLRPNHHGQVMLVKFPDTHVRSALPIPYIRKMFFFVNFCKTIY